LPLQRKAGIPRRHGRCRQDWFCAGFYGTIFTAVGQVTLHALSPIFMCLTDRSAIIRKRDAFEGGRPLIPGKRR